MSTESSGGSESRFRGLKPFPKGVSGNPGGRNKRLEAFKRDARKLLPSALARAAKMLESDDPAQWKTAMDWLARCVVPAPKDPADPKTLALLSGGDGGSLEIVVKTVAEGE